MYLAFLDIHNASNHNPSSHVKITKNKSAREKIIIYNTATVIKRKLNCSLYRAKGNNLLENTAHAQDYIIIIKTLKQQKVA